MAKRKVFFNGKFVDESEAKVSIYDSSLMFGDMVFEMTRSFNSKQWKLDEHIDRLFAGIKILRIPVDFSKKYVKDKVLETIEVNKPAFEPDDEHRILIDVSRGLLSIYENIPDLHKGSNLIIADFPLKWTVQNCSFLYDKGINLHITNQKAIPSYYMDPKIKNRSRLFYLMANIEASQVKGENNWALLLDENGFIAEGTGSNFFMLKKNKLYTPFGKDVLRGITMESVIKDIAPKLNIDIEYANIEPFDVYDADECFLTSTPFCLLPCTSLNKLKIGDGKPGEKTMKLLSEWSKLVNVDIVDQIKKWDKKASNYSGTTPYKFQSNNSFTTKLKEDSN